MDIHVQPKNVQDLLPSEILFQTTYWSQIKSCLGWKPYAFDFKSSTNQQGDLLVLIKPLRHGLAGAHIPQGPEMGPEHEKHGLFLEALSQAMIKYMDSSVAFIRYDLPWESPYAVDGYVWSGHPAPRLRELRMNIGTLSWNLRKAAIDLTVSDALIVDLARAEKDILDSMKPKTRYNICLAQRKGVSVSKASVEMLPLFYNLYLQTARRNGFRSSAYRHFWALFSTPVPNPGSTEILFLLASRGKDILAGAIIAISERRAIYLYGASSNEGRNLMGSYAMHWEAMKLVRKKGCLTYDMGSVSPVPDSNHPFYGMYRFKTGFGGQIVHRNGSWDYPINVQGYETFRNFEMLDNTMFAV